MILTFVLALKSLAAKLFWEPQPSTGAGVRTLAAGRSHGRLLQAARRVRRLGMARINTAAWQPKRRDEWE